MKTIQRKFKPKIVSILEEIEESALEKLLESFKVPQTNKAQLLKAAMLLKKDYATNQKLVAFTALDKENFYA